MVPINLQTSNLGNVTYLASSKRPGVSIKLVGYVLTKQAHFMGQVEIVEMVLAWLVRREAVQVSSPLGDFV